MKANLIEILNDVQKNINDLVSQIPQEDLHLLEGKHDEVLKAINNAKNEVNKVSNGVND